MRFSSRHRIGLWLLAAALSMVIEACGSGSGTTSVQAPIPTTSAGPKVRGSGAGKPPVTLGTKNFTEELILGQLYAQALRARGYKVTLKPNIGASEVMQGKLASHVIDGYPEYTGTILSVLAHDPARPASAAVAYAKAAAFERSRGDALLAMAPATDTDIVIAKPQYATAHHLHTLADIGRLNPPATLAGAPEFRTRFNGLVGLREVYGVSNLHFLPVRIGRQYGALADGRAELAAVFTTDGQLTQGGYTALEDPKNIFGFQNVTFVVRGDVLAREGPAFAETINLVSANLSTQALQVMNAAVVLDQQDPAAVARQFLAADGLV